MKHLFLSTYMKYSRLPRTNKGIIKMTLVFNGTDVTLELQLVREAQMRQDGVDRFEARAAKQKHLSKSETHFRVLEEAIARVAEAIRLGIEVEQAKTQGRKFLWVTALEGIEPEVLAYIGLNAAMDCCGMGGSLTTAITTMGRRVETEVWAAGLKEFDEKQAKQIAKLVTKSHATDRKRLEAAKGLAGKKGFRLEKWSANQVTKAGTPIWNAVAEFSNIFYEAQEYSKNNTSKFCRMHKDAQVAIAVSQEALSWLKPMYSAFVVKPKPWAAFDTGSYHCPKLASSVTLVKDATFSQKSNIANDFKKSAAQGTLPAYVLAVNALQEVPLEINKTVVDAVRWCWEQGKEFGKFPRSTELQPLDRVVDWAALSEVEQKRHMSTSKKIKEKNAAIRSGAIVMQRDLDSAKDLAQFEEFYLGWNLDTRCRAYPISHFNYHRDDHIKAMFLLANGSALTQENDEWLMIHIANTGDFDKVSKESLEDRVAWFLENEKLVLSVLVDPQLSFDFWSKADKPLQFFAACLEWGRYKFQGEGYLCGIAPALDGSCSGSQHYSAASRNTETGKLVNLVPADKPQDVYKTLADAVNKVLNSISKGSKKTNEDKIMADLWLKYGVGRKELKTNCMTFVYSSRQYGFSEQIKKQIMEDITDQVLHSKTAKTHFFGDIKSQDKAAKFLAGISYACVQQVLSPAAEGMDFFQKCAGALAKEGKPMHWRTPIGFPVTQKYTKWNTQKVKVYLYDRVAGVKKRAQITLNTPDPDRICVRQSKSGISPNIIHSMDSSHLLSTVLALKERGINSMMMIHDSFAVPCEHSWDLFNIVRETFIAQYDDYCLYEAIWKSTMQQLSDTSEIEELPRPAKGDLDLARIADSDFCFA